MKKILLSVAAAASLLATPVFAQTAIANRLSGDAEIGQQQEWQQLVDKAAADRHAPTATGDFAAVKSNSATDAAAAKSVPQQAAPMGRYQTMEDYWTDRS